jgi:hypothetical protein
MAEASSSLRWNLKTLFGSSQGSFSQTILSIKEMYETLEPKLDPTVNGLRYPNAETTSDKGMALELRYVQHVG